jgi:pimeloyl-[acyl-carrier protein] methyl ester esterase
LIVTGGRDALVPGAVGAWLARTIPGARHVDIAGAAHAPFLSHPRAFNAEIEEFLDAR